MIGNLYSQTIPQEGCNQPPKKILKLIQNTKEETEIPKKIEGFMESIQVGSIYAMPHYEFGLYCFEDAMKQYDKGSATAETIGDKQMIKAEGLFQKAVSACENYHASIYYYLGVINYYQKENETSLKYLKQFQAFEDPDVKKYDKDHDQKLNDIKDIVQQLEEEAALYANPVPFNPILVQNVSSQSDEYFPMMSPDNEMMFYTRKSIRDNKYVEDYTYSIRPDMNGVFDTGTPFKNPFNDGSFDSYGSATMSVDNKEMIICACKDVMAYGQKYRNCDLYATRFERSGKGGNDYTWTPLENLGPNINDIGSWDAQPTLSPDGKMLLYTRNGVINGTQTGDNDLFVSYRDERGRWTKSVPIDFYGGEKIINTDAKEKSPFLHQDGETLYFVSSSTDERKGVGGTDIFISKYNRKSKKWSRPKNIGYPINTKEDEIGLFVSTNGQLAYFSSKAGGNSFDIYAFELPQEAKPDAVALVKGDLKDNQGNPISGGTIEITYGETGETEKIDINGNDGKYAAIVRVEKPQDIVITVKKEGHSFDTKTITKQEIEKIRSFVKQETHLFSNKHKQQKDTTSSISKVEHKDVLHNKTAQKHHKEGMHATNESTDTSSTATTSPDHKDFLHSKSAQSHHKKQEVSTENSILDGSGVSSNTNDENSILDGKPLNSMVIKGLDMNVQPLEVGMTYTINNILFSSGSYILTDNTKTIIKEFSKFLIENPSIQISIQGHTDDQGDASKNITLSQNRANAVKEYLISLGININRLEAIGYGSAKPKVPNDTDENRKMNRRTEFQILKL
jgi:outer membrane protein OmpA-like peptidoglycan-associated protein